MMDDVDTSTGEGQPSALESLLQREGEAAEMLWGDHSETLDLVLEEHGSPKRREARPKLELIAGYAPEPLEPVTVVEPMASGSGTFRPRRSFRSKAVAAATAASLFGGLAAAATLNRTWIAEVLQWTPATSSSKAPVPGPRVDAPPARPAPSPIESGAEDDTKVQDRPAAGREGLLVGRPEQERPKPTPSTTAEPARPPRPSSDASSRGGTLVGRRAKPRTKKEGTQRPAVAAPSQTMGSRDLAPRARTSPPKSAPLREETKTEQPVSTPESLLREANQLRSKGRDGAALSGYLKLEQTYPASEEASIAKVSRARIHLRRGEQRAAAKAYRAYLRDRPGGPLAQVAWAGLADCHQQLGEPAAEARAWRSLLRSYPNTIYQTKASRRLRMLEAEH